MVSGSTDAPFGSVWTYNESTPFMAIGPIEMDAGGGVRVVFLNSGARTYDLAFGDLAGFFYEDLRRRLPGYKRVDIEGDEE